MSGTNWFREAIARVREAIVRLLSTVRPRRTDADLEEELRLHLELAHEADRSVSTASRPQVGVSQAMDALRDQRRWPWLGDLVRDTRDGLRTLRRSPTFTGVSLVTLAIGIGATTAVFTVVNSILLEPLAYPEADQLVGLRMTAPGAPGVADVSGDLRLSQSMYLTFADHNRTFQQVGIWDVASATVTGIGDPEEVRALRVTEGTLDALAVVPALGRWINGADQTPGGPKVVMLGYGYWQRAFGGATDVLGREVRVNEVPREIVGVMARDFTLDNVTPDLILAAQIDRRQVKLSGFGFEGVGRLKPGVTLAEADADLARLVPVWIDSWPAPANLNPHVYDAWRIAPALRPLKQNVVGRVGNVLWVLLGTVGVLMLIACANVANLLLVRADGRARELAVRAALGAGRSRIVRGLLVESLLLALAGGLLGLGLAEAGLHALLAINPPNVPRLSEIALNGRVLAVAIGLSVFSGLLFGLLPALRSAGPRIAAVLHAGGRTASESRERRRTRDLLVVTQVALAVVLLICAGLMLRTFHALGTVDPGFTDGAHVQTLRLSIPYALGNDEQIMRLESRLVDNLAAIPGVTAVGFASVLPLDGRPPDWDDFIPEGRLYRPGEVPAFRVFKDISPGYFRATGTAVVAGRDFTWTDLEGLRRVVIVSANLATEQWGSPAGAVGKRLHTLEDAPWREVVGVAADTRDNGVDEPAPATVYWPAYTENRYKAGASTVSAANTFSIRTDRAGSPAFLADVRQAVWSVSRSLPLASVQTLADLYRQSMARTSLAFTMLTVAAAMGLVLGVIGIYGLVAYSVSQRTREIGIRVALGAEGGPLTVMFVRDGLLLAGAGIGLGLLAAVGLTRLIASLLFGTGPLDLMTYTVVPLFLALAAALASYVPARRAATVDPVRALRAD